jgi:RNA polymerase sigma-70 factor (ECF subfamily)
VAERSKWDAIELLVRRARRGDEDAFRDLVNQHRAAVTSTLFACGVRCEETAHDLAQEVTLRAWTKLRSLKDPRTFPAWVRRIAANAARDHLRRAAVAREEDLENAMTLDAGDNPHELAERSAELALMMAALAEEDDEVIQILVARAEGVSGEKLAQSLGISADALKMRVMRMRKRLRARLSELRGETGR